MKLVWIAAALAVLTGCGAEPPAAVAATDSTPGAESSHGMVVALAAPESDDPVQVEPQSPSVLMNEPLWENLPEPEEDGYRHLEWTHLMPADFSFELAMSNLDDAPIVEELNGELIRIPGYILPLDADMERVYRFLVVPYVGACVHVPPPPSNQLIYAQSEDGMESAELWEAVYIYGTLNAQTNDTEWGKTGYVLDVDRWEPYTW